MSTNSHAYTPAYVRQSKYRLVGDFLQGRTGSLLDIGARDRVLVDYLDKNSLNYQSHDLVPGHNYDFDLEKPIPLGDRSFDYVTALDVLEHLEPIHERFADLMRITGQYLFITLPNMSSLGFRLRFLLTGALSGKYTLLPEHQGDHHRWLTIYPEIYHFVEVNAGRNGFSIDRACNILEDFRYFGLMRPLVVFSRLAMLMNWKAKGVFTHTILFILKRDGA